MCNKLHPDSILIPGCGVGWKIFSCDRDYPRSRRLCPLVMNDRPFPRTEWVEWNKHFCGDGFGFFLSKRAAISAARKWATYPIAKGSARKLYIHRIDYTHGLGKHKERGFINGYVTIALARRFRIRERVWSCIYKEGEGWKEKPVPKRRNRLITLILRSKYQGKR